MSVQEPVVSVIIPTYNRAHPVGLFARAFSIKPAESEI